MQAANYPSLAGRRVFITGGATGIGAALVVAFTDQQVQVGFIDVDVARLALFLAAEDACAITGQTVVIDGGRI